MVNINAEVAEAGVVALDADVRKIVRVLFALPTLLPRVAVANTAIDFIQGSTSLSAVSPDYTLNGGMTASA